MEKKTIVMVLWVLVLTFTFVAVGFSANIGSSRNESDVPKLPERLTEEQIDAFLARMSDDQVRRLLLDQLKESARREAIHSVTGEDPFQRQADLFNLRLRQVLGAARNNLTGELSQAYHRLTRDRGIGGLFIALLKAAFLLGLGFLAEHLIRRRQTNLAESIGSIAGARGSHRFRQALFKAINGIIYLLVFFLVAFIVFQIVYSKDDPSRYFGYAIFMMVFLIRIFALAMDLVFSPKDREARLAGLNDDSAALIHHWGMIALSLGIIAGLFSKMILFLGVSPELGMFFRCFAPPLFALPLIIMAILHGRRTITNMKAGGISGATEGVLNKMQYTLLFHALFIIYVVLGWGVSQFTMLVSGQGAMWYFLFSFMVIPVFIILDRLGQSALRRVLKQKSPEGEVEAADDGNTSESTPDSVEKSGPPVKLASRGLRFFLVIMMIAGLIRYWNINLPWSGAVSEAGLSILVTLLLVHLAWEYTKAAIERRLGGPTTEDETATGREDEGGGTAKGRLYTLLPLFRKFIGVVLFVTAVLVVLSSIGVEIAPLLASAGIFGLAIGLGAQTLVKDIVAGIFFLADDAFRVGEYVSMGSVEGFVEKISIRTVTMRHHKGQVEIIPYGDINTVTNFSRGPMLVKFNLPVPIDTDVKQVKKIVKKINEEMMADEEFGPNLVDPIKSQGVKTIEDGVMLLRVKFRAQPGTQFLIKRQVFQRIQKAFKKKGISFASRGVSIVQPPAADTSNEKQGQPTEIPKEAAAAAAGVLLDTANQAGVKEKR